MYQSDIGFFTFVSYLLQSYKNSELPNDDHSDTLIPNKDFLLYVKVYEPFASQSGPNRATSYYPLFPKLRNVISIHGNQSLYQLRQMISCQSDFSIATEISENPKRMPGPMASVSFFWFSFLFFL